MQVTPAVQRDCGPQQLSMDSAAEISQTFIPVQFEPITYFGLAFALLCLAGGAGEAVDYFPVLASLKPRLSALDLLSLSSRSLCFLVATLSRELACTSIFQVWKEYLFLILRICWFLRLS